MRGRRAAFPVRLLSACLVAAGVGGARDICTVDNDVIGIYCSRTPPCISQSWLLQDSPHSCNAENAADIEWPVFPLDTDGFSPMDGSGLLSLARGPWAGKTVVLDGDSLMEEQYAAMSCGLRGKGLRVRDAPMCTPERRGLRADHYPPECAQLFPGLPPRAVAFYEGARAVPAADWSDYGIPRHGIYVEDTDTFLVRKGWGRFKRSDFEAVARLGDAVLSQYGLHYKEEDAGRYREDLEELMAVAKSLGKPFYVKEVSAQHFLGTGAYGDWSQAHPDKSVIQAACKCAEMNATVRKANWVARQNAILEEVAKKHGVTVLPFYDRTADRPDMHVGPQCVPGWQSCSCDCTHNCYSASFWKHVFLDWLVAIRLAHGDATDKSAADADGAAAVAAILAPAAGGGGDAVAGGPPPSVADVVPPQEAPLGEQQQQEQQASLQQ